MRSVGFPESSTGKESAGNAGDLSSIPGLGGSPGEENGCSLQYSGVENSLDCIVHKVAKSQTRLSDFHIMTSHPSLLSKSFGNRNSYQFLLTYKLHEYS